MLNFRQFVRPLIPVATVILLCLNATPAAEANNGSSTQKSSTTALEQHENAKQTKPVAPKKTSQRSVLDADMLERPLSFLNYSFSSDEEKDSDDMFSHSTTVVVAVKALIASLLSTII